MRLRVCLLALAAATLACNTILPPAVRTPTPRAVPTASATRPPTASPIPPTLAPSATLTPSPAATDTATIAPATTAAPAASPTVGTTAGGVRTCAFVPGVSVAAQLPPGLLTAGTPTPEPPPALPANSKVAAITTTAQLQVFHDLINTINANYVYTNVVKQQVPALKKQFEQLVAGGLTDDDFYLAMADLIVALGDDHSYFESPAQAKASDASFAGNNDYVGIGVLAQAVPEAGRAVVVVTFPGGPAAAAGLRSHDSILAVNGQPVLDAAGAIRPVLRGPAGSSLVLTVQRPGEPSKDITLQRQRITGALPIDDCLFAGTRIGYLYLPGLDDDTIPDQVRAALRAMTADGPLAGLVLDNRENGGGASTVLEPLLGLFTHGPLGHFVARDESRAMVIPAEDLGGSQTVPLVVLVGQDTVSYGEVLSGLLQVSGRAKVIGQTTLGNVETQWAYSFKDGSRVWLAHELFQPPGLPLAIWEATGIVPDVQVAVRWDLFTEADDPALAAALDLLNR